MDYKEKLEEAKRLYESANDTQKYVLESLFTKLKKSEVEKIKEDLIEWISDFPDIIWRGHYKKDVIAWLEKQGDKSVDIDIDIESMVSSYKQRLKAQSGIRMENNPLVNMCLTAFRCGVKNTLEELNLKKLEKEDEQETLCEKCRKAQPSHSCQDITALGRCAVEHEQKSDNSYCQEKGFHAEIDDDKVVIKKGEKPAEWSEDDERIKKRLINLVNEIYNNTNYITFLEHKELLAWLEKLDDNIEL